MTRYDDRYDEFGYEREDYDGTLELNEYLTPREVIGKQWRVKRDSVDKL